MSMLEQASAAAKCRQHVKQEMMHRVESIIKGFIDLPKITVSGWYWVFHTNGTFESSYCTKAKSIHQCNDKEIKELVKVWPKIIRKLNKKISKEFNESWKLAMLTNMPVSFSDTAIELPKINDFVLQREKYLRIKARAILVILFLCLLIAMSIIVLVL